MINTKLNDRELVEKIKKTKASSDYEILYKRYTPMINKYAFKVASKFKWSFQEIKDDFHQDAFFQLVKAVDYVDLDKIENDNWTFKIVYYYFLKTLSGTFYKQIFHNNIEQESLTNYQDYLENPSMQTSGNSRSKLDKIGEAIGVPGNHYSEFEEIHNAFMLKLTPRQTEIVKFRQLGFTYDEIKNELGVSFGTVHRDVHLAKEIAKELLDAS